MVRNATPSAQPSLPKMGKRDKNDQFRGGARPGAGRPKRPKSQGRSSEPHRARPPITWAHPLHVVMRTVAGLSLRSIEGFAAVREASIAAIKHEASFRIVHFSIQRNHIHLIVEALNSRALSRGMQAFGISAAKHINAALTATTSERRRGAVFSDRYFARPLKTPREVRNCLAYVLNNWRHHKVDRSQLAQRWVVDPFSSALAFGGWKEQPGVLFKGPSTYDGSWVWEPSLWLLRTGWRKHGLISVYEVPGRSDE